MSKTIEPTMNCQVSFTLPDGRHMRHTGRYTTPYHAMQAVEAQVPGAVASAGIALAQPVAVWRKPTKVERAAWAAPDAVGRSCDDLGVCQSVTKPCPSHTICARKSSPFYFAPGTINGGSSDLQLDGAGWLLETTWIDWIAGIAILVILGAICGYLS
jgi:hypothetical protein